MYFLVILLIVKDFAKKSLRWRGPGVRTLLLAGLFSVSSCKVAEPNISNGNSSPPAPPLTISSYLMLNEKNSTPLFTALLLEPRTIQKEADEKEKRHRTLILQEMQRLTVKFCSSNTDIETLNRYRYTLKQEHELLQSLEMHRSRMMQHRIEKDAALLNVKEATEALQLVSRMEEERRELLYRAWSNFFDRFETKKGGDLKKICEKNRLDRSTTDLPKEKLYLPIYIARYRFFSLLPATSRTLILADRSHKINR